jgi:cytochrome c biogenesis protein ResB
VARRSFLLTRFLRSRRLAVGLILAVIGYSVVGTLVPQAQLGAGGPDVAAWQRLHPLLATVTRPLGLHSAFGSPLFLLVVFVLALAIAACSWERTRAAWSLWRRAGTVSEADVRRLKERPHVVLPLAGMSAERALDRVDAGLRGTRLAVRRGPKLVEASSTRWGLLGSPVFHWILAALFVLVAVGRLTRAEGVVGVPLGTPVTDMKSSYGLMSEGPLYPGHSGLRIDASDLVLDYRDRDGMQRGASPIVTLSDARGVVARQHVYPNNPLRHGRLMVHMAGYGLAAAFSLESTGGAATEVVHSLVDFRPSTASGTTTQTLDLSGPDGKLLQQVGVTIPADRERGGVLEQMPRDPRVEVKVVGRSGLPVTMRPGQVIQVREGVSLKLASIGYYVRLSIADDGSVYPLYALFILASAAMSVSVFASYRTVRVLLVEGPDRPTLHAVIAHRRGDQLFAERIEAVLREAVAQEAHEKEESA